MTKISRDWALALREETRKDYYKNLSEIVENEYRTAKVFPPSEDIFNAFKYTPLSEIKAVIIGQDPYHNDGQATGLCFSVNPDVEIPPSLANIYKELHDDLNIPIADHGYLKKWADQGVFLLNAVLTVRAYEAASHKNIGWEEFTDAAIKIINEQDRPIVFMLWGGFARAKKVMLKNPKHLVLEAAHPSPLSAYRGFFGCRHFSKCNDFLIKNGVEPIDWDLTGEHFS